MKRITSPQELDKFRLELQAKINVDSPCIYICASTGCRAFGAENVIDTIKEELRKHNLENKIKIKVTGCHGFCEKGPIVVIQPQDIFYVRCKADKIPEVISKTILKGESVEELLYTDTKTGVKIKSFKDIPFYKNQVRLVLDKSGKIDPTDIEDYIVEGGYASLSKSLFKMKREEIINEVKVSGLRGRGGAGFPTGKKWEIVSKQQSKEKYVICNGDEGDPGAYMDRCILESNPHSVIEGMIIGAFAIGAQEGWVYVRHEYPLAVKHVSLAIEQARKYGFLGNNVLGSGFNFDIKIARGAGAFVCGEETALIASIEGKRGEPRQRPPYPAERGLFGKPTNINNVETWANVPLIIEKSGDWFSKIGTKTSKGTKVFSLVGKVQNSGLVEVPMGVTIGELVYKIGDGAANGKKIKAIQIGGPSGGCIPEELFNLPIDYESLTMAGAMMGSGGMIVMDEDSCMVDIAKYFTNFLQDESCGKCSTCREGTQRMYEILSNITEGKATDKDLILLEELACVIKDASMCGLGQTAPNPVMSTLKYFKDEHLAHIREGRCPARVCKSLIRFFIDETKCKGCTLCKKECPQQTIIGEVKKTHTIIQDNCIKCGVCYDVCKFDAIVKTSGEILCQK